MRSVIWFVSCCWWSCCSLNSMLAGCLRCQWGEIISFAASPRRQPVVGLCSAAGSRDGICVRDLRGERSHLHIWQQRKFWYERQKISSLSDRSRSSSSRLLSDLNTQPIKDKEIAHTMIETHRQQSMASIGGWGLWIILQLNGALRTLTLQSQFGKETTQHLQPGVSQPECHMLHWNNCTTRFYFFIDFSICFQ